MTEIVSTSGSPFDALRHEDEHGEYWLAREIAVPLGYTWRGFTDAIERGRIALQVNGQDPDTHIESRKTPSGFQRGRREVADYRMTREGVDVTIQGGDPRKPEIAAGWAYYRGKTREAEAMQRASVVPVPQTLQEALRAYADSLDYKAEAERRAQESDRRALEARQALDDFIASEGNEEIGAVGRLLNVSPTKFQEFLRDIGVMGRGSNLDGPQGCWNKPVGSYRHRDDLFRVRNKRVTSGEVALVAEATPAGQHELKRLFDAHWSTWCQSNNRKPDGTKRTPRRSLRAVSDAA
jgi:hypothetical protein